MAYCCRSFVAKLFSPNMFRRSSVTELMKTISYQRTSIDNLITNLPSIADNFVSPLLSTHFSPRPLSTHCCEQSLTKTPWSTYSWQNLCSQVVLAFFCLHALIDDCCQQLCQPLLTSSQLKSCKSNLTIRPFNNRSLKPCISKVRILSPRPNTP